MVLLEPKAMVTLEELMISSLAMTDALTKLLIEKGVINEQEFREKVAQERAISSYIEEDANAVTCVS